MTDSPVIYVIDESNELAISIEEVLSACGLNVRVISSSSGESYDIRPADILMINLDPLRADNFTLLDHFMSTDLRPGLIIISPQNGIFKHDDTIIYGGAHILFRPFVSNELIQKVRQLL